MTPILTLYKKEFRQHGTFAIAMVLMCLLFQIAYSELCRFNNTTIHGEPFLGVALLIALLYAGAAAALAYSTEHAENTFVFLRKLPVSWGTVACGKTAWVLCGTVAVLVANLLLCLIFFAVYQTGMAFNAEQLWGAIGIGIIEVFVWGLFWSTRCRSQVHALLATYLSAAASLYVVAYVFAIQSDNAVAMYAEIVPHRLVVAGIVALAAVWGMSRWFSFEAKKPLIARLYPEKMTLAYPQAVQMPFAALVHHHVRHASILYPLGILSMLVFSAGCLFLCYLYAVGWTGTEVSNFMATGWFTIGAIVCATGIVLFWGTIFGHDQKRDSYKFLGRIGVHEGAVWWSRMLPAMILSVPATLCLLGYLLVHDMSIIARWSVSDPERVLAIWDRYVTIAVPICITIWLAPIAVGAFVSISFRSQMVAIALTAGGLFLPIFWGTFFLAMLDLSPWWTTVPICIALLVGSRIRAAYWLRETFTWRSRIIPLVPVFATLLAVLIAVPMVRVYSVPHVSWSQIDAYFEQADLGDMIRAPEKRKALIQHIAQHGTVSEEYETWLKRLGSSALEWEFNVFDSITAEEYLLVRYVLHRQGWDRLFTFKFWQEQKKDNSREHYSYMDYYWRWCPYMPWEQVRGERRWRLHIVGELVDAGGIQDKRAVAIRDYLVRQNDKFALFDEGIYFFRELDARVASVQQFRHTLKAMDKWYAEHGTVPESLDELVEHGYLSALPLQPFTDKVMEYHRDAPAPAGITTNEVIVGILDMKEWDELSPAGRDAQNKMRWEVRDNFPDTGGTYLRLGKWVYVIVEQASSQETEDRIQETEENDNNNDDAFDAFLGTVKE